MKKFKSIKNYLSIVCISLIALYLPFVYAQNQKASDKYADSGSFIPPGVVMPYAGSTAPSGWVLAYGQEVSQTGTYAKLYAAISTTYCTTEHGGTCTGGNFRLPDLRGRSLAGKDNMGGSAANRLTAAGSIDGTVLGKTGGTQNHSIGTTNLPTHTHGVSISSGAGSTHSHGISFASAAGSAHSHGANTFATSLGLSGSAPSLGSNTVGSSGHNHRMIYNGGLTWGSGVSISFRNGTLSGSGTNYLTQDGMGYPSTDIYTGAVNGTTTVTISGGSYSLTGSNAVTGTSASESSHTHSVSGTSNAENSHNHSVSGDTGNGGFANTAIQNLQPTAVVNYIIKL